MASPKDFDNSVENKWCPGCGNHAILSSIKDALARLGLAPRDVLIVSGIGQAAKTPHYLNCNFFHGLHGRALPVATGAKAANHSLTILVNSGDGDCYGEGGNHFIHAIRRNPDITVIVHNNMVYGLTKGQASPTSQLGHVTDVQTLGNMSIPLNPVLLALALGAGLHVGSGLGFLAPCGRGRGHRLGAFAGGSGFCGWGALAIQAICSALQILESPK